MLMKNNPFIIKNNKLIQYLLITILCFFPDILYINKLGYYWDDWSQLFLHYKFGDAAFWEYFSYNRPLSAWTDIMFFPICGNSPVKWHMLILVLKTCLCILFLKILSLTFRENKTFVNIAVLLFAVCPLFSQTYIAIAYSQHFTDYILFALSVYCLLKFTFAQKMGKICIVFSIYHFHGIAFVYYRIFCLSRNTESSACFYCDQKSKQKAFTEKNFCRNY